MRRPPPEQGAECLGGGGLQSIWPTLCFSVDVPVRQGEPHGRRPPGL